MDSRNEATDRTILVAGATGHQGGAVARALLDHGFAVRGLTRDPDQPESRRLEDRGAEMVRGDLYDPESLEPVVRGVDGVFCVTDFWTQGSQGYAGQIRQGTNLARVAAEESAAMCEWLIDDGFDADIEALGEEFGPLTTLREYLEGTGWDRRESEPAVVTNWAAAVATG